MQGYSQNFLNTNLVYKETLNLASHCARALAPTWPAIFVRNFCAPAALSAEATCRALLSKASSSTLRPGRCPSHLFRAVIMLLCSWSHASANQVVVFCSWAFRSAFLHDSLFDMSLIYSRFNTSNSKSGSQPFQVRYVKGAGLQSGVRTSSIQTLYIKRLSGSGLSIFYPVISPLVPCRPVGVAVARDVAEDEGGAAAWLAEGQSKKRKRSSSKLQSASGKSNEKGKGLVHEGLAQGKVAGLWMLRGPDLG